MRILSLEIKKISRQSLTLMEVCGTHTMNIARYGIRSLLPENVQIISGPGCPVCVTSVSDLQMAINLAKEPDVIIATFGDMLKVPVQGGDTLQNYKNVKIVYSPLDALQIAQDNFPSKKEVVLLGIGFETTIPLIAATIKCAYEQTITNFSVLSMHKIIPPALDVVLSARDNKINGLILPGHVSVITGSAYFNFLKKYQTSGVIAGFAALEIMESIYLLVRFLNEGRVEIANNYQRVVSAEGNLQANLLMNEVFQISDANWRGIGIIPNSGMEIVEKYASFDTKKRFSHAILHSEQKIEEAPGCLCGGILMGKFNPNECGHFAKRCTPATPIGPCMVSSEGTCAAYYKYSLLK
ncbi:MAG: hydrogenase formation protein HypD [Oligoflexia bacterium]|nr:hydrogenase formation protein HypD [Oligoflexia bacterium]